MGYTPDCSIETKCVQAGWQPKSGEPRVLPIYESTTYKYDTSADMAKLFDLQPGYMYTRLANPTNDAVASKIAELEGGVAAVLTSSGQAANFFALINIFRRRRPYCKLSYNLRRYIQSSQCYNEENRHRCNFC